MSRSGLAAAVPGLAMLGSYRPQWLGKDISAGLVLSALLVPQGMAYAELAGLPAITGLYTTIMCLVAYAVFGPSRVLVLGPDSSLGPMIAATVIPLVADGDPARAVTYAAMLALMVGAITVLAGVFRLGFIADLLSRPTQIGYMNGLALTILIGRLPKLFGFSVDGDGLIAETAGFVEGVVDGLTNPAALLVGIGSLLVILLLGRFAPRIPGVLVAVVAAIAVAVAFQLDDQSVDLVGPLPQGFPPFTLPTVPLEDLALLVAGALGIALVSLTDTISTASAFAARRGDDVDGDREMIGIGAANIAAGLFQGFPVSTSGSRTAVAEQNGAKTQVTGLVGALAVTMMLLFVPGLLKDLPQPTLAAIVIAASLSLADVTQRPAPDVAAAAVRFLAGRRGLSRCGALGRAAGHRCGSGPFGARRVQSRLSGRTEPYSAACRDWPGTTTPRATRTRSSWPDSCSIASTRPSSSRTRAPSATTSGASPTRSRRRGGLSSPPSRSRTWTRQPPTWWPISTSGWMPAESASSWPR